MKALGEDIAKRNYVAGMPMKKSAKKIMTCMQDITERDAADMPTNVRLVKIFDET